MAEDEVVQKLLEKFNTTKIDVSDIETKVLTSEQVEELVEVVKTDMSKAQKVVDVLDVLKKVGETAIKMGVLSALA